MRPEPHPTTVLVRPKQLAAQPSTPARPQPSTWSTDRQPPGRQPTFRTAEHGRILYEGNDPHRIRETVAARLAPHRLFLPGNRQVRARLRVLHQGDVSVYELGYGTEAKIILDGRFDNYLAVVAHQGFGQTTVNGVDIPFSPAILGPGHRTTLHWAPATTALIVSIPRTVIHRALRHGLDEKQPRVVRFAPRIDQSDIDARQWVALARNFSEMVGSGLLADSAVAVGHYEQVLVHSLLTCQPSSVREHLNRGANAVPSALRRALAYCEQHASDPVSVANVASAAGVSVRSLQEKFRVHLGVTPLAHLRQLRLAGANADLLAVAEGRARGTVTEVALRWGFSHLGRFGSLYRAAYGRLPSQTLRHGAEEPDPAS